MFVKCSTYSYTRHKNLKQNMFKNRYNTLSISRSITLTTIGDPGTYPGTYPRLIAHGTVAVANCEIYLSVHFYFDLQTEYTFYNVTIVCLDDIYCQIGCGGSTSDRIFHMSMPT